MNLWVTHKHSSLIKAQLIVVCNINSLTSFQEKEYVDFKQHLNFRNDDTPAGWGRVRVRMEAAEVKTVHEK